MPTKSHPRTMTKQEALAEFNADCKPVIIAEMGFYDRVALAEEWSNFTDALAKQGCITRHQDQTWTNPF